MSKRWRWARGFRERLSEMVQSKVIMSFRQKESRVWPPKLKVVGRIVEGLVGGYLRWADHIFACRDKV
jgi:hypothetical protein